VGLFLAAGLVAFQLVAAHPKYSEIRWESDLQAAHRLSVRQDRPLLIVFGADWCGYCHKLERDTFSDPEMAAYVHQNFVPVHLDFDRDRRIAGILEVKSVPTTIILSPKADLLGTVVGYVKTDRYRKSLAAALNFEKLIEQ
jgi:thioredoxin-related protein